MIKKAENNSSKFWKEKSRILIKDGISVNLIINSNIIFIDYFTYFIKPYLIHAIKYLSNGKFKSIKLICNSKEILIH